MCSSDHPHSSYVNTWSWEYVGLLFGPTQAVEIKDAGRIESPDDDLTLGATDIALAADGSTLIAITAPNWFDSGAGEASNGHYGCHVIEITDITGPSISTNIFNPDLPKNKGRIDTPSLMPDGRGWDGGTHDGANLAILDDDEQEHWLGNSTCSYDSHATGSTVSGIIEAFKYHVTSPYVQKVFLHNSDWRP